MTWGDVRLLVGLLGPIAGGVWIAPRVPRLVACVRLACCWLVAAHGTILIETWISPPMVGPDFEDGWMTLQRGVAFSIVATPLRYLFLAVVKTITRRRVTHATMVH